MFGNTSKYESQTEDMFAVRNSEMGQREFMNDMYGRSTVLPTGEVDDEDTRGMSVSAVVSPTGALVMVGFFAVVDRRSPLAGGL